MEEKNMKKKKMVRAFTILMALTGLVCLICAVAAYCYEKDIEDKYFPYFLTSFVVFCGVLAVLHEADLFYTVYYFNFRQKDKRTSFLNIAAHLCLGLFTVYLFLSEFIIMELRYFESVLPWLFGAYLILRIGSFVSIRLQKKQ